MKEIENYPFLSSWYVPIDLQWKAYLSCQSWIRRYLVVWLDLYLTINTKFDESGKATKAYKIQFDRRFLDCKITHLIQKSISTPNTKKIKFFFSLFRKCIKMETQTTVSKCQQTTSSFLQFILNYIGFAT